MASASSDRTVRLWDAATGAALQLLGVDVAISRLSFSKEGPYLETDRELLSIQPPHTSTFPTQAQLPHKIFVKEHWVTREMENLLWLPSNYRATCSAFQHNILALGHLSGHVTFIEFSLS